MRGRIGPVVLRHHPSARCVPCSPRFFRVYVPPFPRTHIPTRGGSFGQFLRRMEPVIEF